jgi:flagellar protein FliL
MGRLVPLLLAAAAALAVGGGAGWYFGVAAAPKTVIVREEPPRSVEYTIKDRIVNLADPGGRRYLKVSMVLQVQESKKAQAGGTLRYVGWEQPGTTIEAVAKETPAELPNAPQVHDAITTVLSSKRTNEVTSTDGRERLREELRLKINTVLPPGQQVVKIFFTDFVIQ